MKYLVAALTGFIVAALISFGLNFIIASGGGKPDSISWIVGAIFGAIAAYAAANMAGNRKVANASQAEKDQALTFTPPEGQGLLLVYRDGFVGKLVGLNLALDGRPFAQIKSPRFTALAVAPGEHVLTAGFGGLAGPQNRTNESKVTFRPGEVLAVKGSVAMGALTNTIRLEGVPVTDDLRAKLRGMPMVRAENAPTQTAPTQTAPT